MDAFVGEGRIVEVERMSEDGAVLDGLSRAIADFREEVLLWIDTALVRLREREQQDSLAMEQKSAPATLTRSGMERESQPCAPARRFGTRSGVAELEPVIRRQGSWNTAEINGRASPGDPPRPPVVKPAAETPTGSNSPPLDSLKRLDALARLLDERLNVSQEEVSNNPGASDRAGESTS
jgi:hypothetical protein